jgi:aspartyl-tRNA(Asn)/glutamyl-tRNA(Gln) amidotransferase subunit C
MNYEEIKKIAHLARIKLSEEEFNRFANITDLLALIDQLQQVDTAGVEPMAHPIDNAVQMLRDDQVTATNQREKLQPLAAGHVKAGLYIVPAAIEE